MLLVHVCQNLVMLMLIVITRGVVFFHARVNIGIMYIAILKNNAKHIIAIMTIAIVQIGAKHLRVVIAFLEVIQ